jgi:iron complex outermembrane receptor protein
VYEPRYYQDASYGALGPTMAFLYGTLGEVVPNTFLQGAPATLFTARQYSAANGGGTVTPGAGQPTIAVFGPWVGDGTGEGSRIQHGPRTLGTFIEYQSRTEREAFAVYSQGEWQINDLFAITLGLRWAKDRLDGEENAFIYDETLLFPLTNTPGALGVNLATYNFLAMTDPNEPLRLAGIPSSGSLYRHLDLDDDEVTWRVNLDWTPTDNALIYAGVTTGHRSAGLGQLGSFSSIQTYDGEDLTAYELGYKGQLLDGQLQLNASIYYYDYETIHTLADVPSALSANGTSVSIVPVDEAEIWGIEIEPLWLATDNLTLGGNISYTPSEYKSDFNLINNFNPNEPQSVFVSAERQENIKGNQLMRVPELKGALWGSYMWQLGDMGSLEFMTSYTWIDDVYFSAFEHEEDKAEAYSRWDLRATWSSANDSWMVAGFVNNVLDEIGVRQIDRGTEGTNWLRKGSTSDPRLYGLEVRYKFGALY